MQPIEFEKHKQTVQAYKTNIKKNIQVRRQEKNMYASMGKKY